MSQFLKYLALCCAVIAVAAAQVIGTQASYFCGCTGQKSILEYCAPSCHADSHDHETCSGKDAEHAEHGEAPTPFAPGHDHGKVVQELLGTHIFPVVETPGIIWVAVVTDPFPADLFDSLLQWWTPALETKPPEEEVPAEGVLVARTTVIVV